MARLYVPLDVNCQDDPAIVRAGPDAELLFYRGLQLAKRLGKNGDLDTAHVARLGADLPAVVAGEVSAVEVAKRLVAEGVWDETETGFRPSAWLAWNPSQEDLEEQRAKASTGGTFGNHRRWHRGKPNPDCQFCRSTESPPDRPPIATPNRVGSLRDSEERVKEPPSGGAPAPTARGALFTKICDLLGVDADMLSRSERSDVNKTVKELAEVGIEPGALDGFPAWWSRTFPNTTLTHRCFRQHYAKYASNGQGTKRLRCPEHPDRGCLWLEGSGWSHSQEVRA